ncbi:hypothetical protein XHC_1067 [Xanthomonas hortorum pv. carotae str. M081]|nr:hypothetical protein XHC_1067 [Xanthomonas hortorum pv. carotae str. M081]
MDVATISRGGDKRDGSGDLGFGIGDSQRRAVQMSASPQHMVYRDQQIPNPESPIPPEAAGLRSQTV